MANLWTKYKRQSVLYRSKQQNSLCSKRIRTWWLAKTIAEFYATNGGTPHLDRRHTVFGQIMDDDSYKVLDEIANVETGAQDRPVEDVVIETIEVVD